MACLFLECQSLFVLVESFIYFDFSISASGYLRIRSVQMSSNNATSNDSVSTSHHGTIVQSYASVVARSNDNEVLKLNAQIKALEKTIREYKTKYEELLDKFGEQEEKYKVEKSNVKKLLSTNSCKMCNGVGKRMISGTNALGLPMLFYGDCGCQKPTQHSDSGSDCDWDNDD